MNIRKYIIVLTVILFAGGCNDWLDVNPRQEMKETALFASEEGFKNAMNGVYIKLASSGLYGKNTSMFLPEMLAHHWTLPSGSGTTEYALGQFDYTYSGVESLIESVWKNYYSAIVQLNNVLAGLDENVVNFSFNNDKLVKGEALGLRGFLHFELLRYFGSIPSQAIAGDRAIPYVTEMTKDPNKLVSDKWSDVVTKIEKDLNDAEELLKDVDPIVVKRNAELNDPGTYTPDDDWQTYRQNRFNYYAVLAAKARFYQWIGEKDKTVTYAKMVVNAANEDKTPKFELATEASFSSTASNSGSLVFTREHLFAIHNPMHQDVVKSLFKEESSTLTQKKDKIATAYESGLNPDDIRNKDRRYWEEKTYQNSATTNHFYKYIGNQIGHSAANTVPLIRLSEMYLILVEHLPLEEARTFFKEYRIAKGLSSYMDEILNSESAVKERLEKEYRKEFFGEGQMFFFYKRFDYKEYTWPTQVSLPANLYVLPIPKSQSLFE